MNERTSPFSAQTVINLVKLALASYCIIVGLIRQLAEREVQKGLLTFCSATALSRSSGEYAGLETIRSCWSTWTTWARRVWMSYQCQHRTTHQIPFHLSFDFLEKICFHQH